MIFSVTYYFAIMQRYIFLTIKVIIYQVKLWMFYSVQSTSLWQNLRCTVSRYSISEPQTRGALY